jgi:CheY-like chemotaxis protein
MPYMPILVIDDNEFIRASMMKFLDANRYSVVGVASAQEAMEQLREQEFGLVITDILMPDTDGFELIDFIRGGEEPMKSLPIIAISGGGRVVDADTLLTSLEERVDYILKKPFSKKELLEKTASLIKKDNAPNVTKQAVPVD